MVESWEPGPDTADIAVLGRLRAVVDELTALDLTGLPQDRLLEFTRTLEEQKRRLPGAEHRLVSELAGRGVAAQLSVRDTRALLQRMLRITPGEALGRVRAAETLGPRQAVSGEPLGALFPAVAAAQSAGAISAEHARSFDPKQLATIARRVRDTLDPDGTLSEPADHERRREVRLSDNPDGSGRLHGTLTPWLLAALRAVLDPLARPRPATDGTRDPRSSGQRYHDALESLVQRMLRSGTLPDSGGTPATILITMKLSDLENRAGLARTGAGTPIPVAEVLRHATDAKVIPVFLNDAGAVAGLGHGKRIATPTQRLALAARDGGCSHPGCDAPPDWCQSHHVVEWQHQHRTNLDELTLLCAYHHLVSVPQGWDCVMIDGIPHWRPPGWIDTHRKPIRNTSHHLIEVVFTPPEDPGKSPPA